MTAGTVDTPEDWLDVPHIRRWAFTAPQVVFLVGFFLPDAWRAIVWPAALLVIGGACVLNALRCGRLHCYFTGPFFFTAAVVLIVYRLGLFPDVPGGWDGLGLAIVAIATILNVIPERLLGRYRSGLDLGRQ